MRSAQLTSAAFLCLVSFATPQATAKEKPKWPPDPNIAATEPLRPEAQKKKIKLPPGFELQLVAADPDIRKPININFDAAGRLWVTETIEYPYAAKPGQGRDAVKILEDFGPDGKARKITTFVDKLNIPIGVLPTAKGALVYSIPSIFHMIDSKGVGKADKREVYYDGFGFDDTHGMTGNFMQGFDGWIYACHGFRNTSNVKSKNGETSITMTSGNTYRFKPDGSRVEQWTWGQVNPFGLAFDPYGNLYSGDCHSQPLTMLLRHGWYVSFNRPHDGLGFAPHMNTFGTEHSTALCGVTYYAADQYPEEYRGMLFLGDVVTNRINAYKLEWHGASPKAVIKEFLTSSDPWFRPVDIKLGPDGCLYFADFYNRIIGHYEVALDHPGRDRDKGRIWRIVYRGKDGKSGPQPVVNLAKADVKTLVAALGSPNLTVRLQATHQLVERGGDEAVKALQPIIKDIKDAGSGAMKAHALWVLERLGRLDDDTLLLAAESKEIEVRVHVQRILTEKKTWKKMYADAIVWLGLLDKERLVQRVALEALAAHPDDKGFYPIIAHRHPSMFDAKDTHLLYASRLALRAQLREPKTWDAMKTVKALNDGWAPEVIADVCLGVHDERSAEYLKSFLLKFDESVVHAQPYTHHIVRYGADSSVGWVLDKYLKKHAANLGLQGSVLKSVAQAAQERGIKLTDADRASAETILAHVLDSKNNEELKSGIAAAVAMKSTKSQPRLLALPIAKGLPADLRKASITALINIDAKQAREPLVQMILDEKLDPSLRGQIARDLGSTNHPEAHAALLKALEVAPARLEFDLAFALTTSKAGAEKLLQAILAGKAPVSAIQGRPILLNLQASRVDVEAHLKKLGLSGKFAAASEEERKKIAARRDAFASFKSDASIGQKVYQKHCANCHQIADKGAKVGPNLDGIGVRGLERLLEDVFDPNRNVDQAFRKTIITTKQGQTIDGLFLREEGKLVILADKEGKEVRIEKAQIDERAVSPLSPMPSNFLDVLSEPEAHHLMAYLLAQRGKS